MRELRDAAAGALLGTFVGDALGMPFERQPAAAIPARLDMQEARLGRGTYTDDTQMMIALAESLLERDAIDAEHLAGSFLEAFDPARGYGSGTVALFRLWREGEPISRAASQLHGGRGSLGNGAAMRIAPIGVRFANSPDKLCAQARRSAGLTHAHPLAIDAAAVQAAAIGAAVRGDDVLAAARDTAETDELRRQLEIAGELLAAQVDADEGATQLGNTSEGHRSVPTAILAAVSQPQFEQAVTFAVRCGGDTDTLGAMAGAIAGARDGAVAIPERWVEALEDGDKGRRHVERLAQALAQRVARP